MKNIFFMKGSFEKGLICVRYTTVFCAIIWCSLNMNCINAQNLAYPADIASWTEAEKKVQRDNALQLQHYFSKACNTGKKTFRIPAGNYRFTEDISVALSIRDIDDMKIEAKDAVFWIEGNKTRAIFIQNSSNILINGLTIDFDPLPFTQGTVKAIHPEKSSITLDIDKGFPVPEGTYKRRGGGLFFGPEGNMLSLHTERVRKGIKTGSEELEIFFEAGKIQSDLSGIDIRKLKFAFFFAYSHGGIQINDSENVSLEGVTCYTWPGFFLINSGGEGGHTYRNLSVVRRPGTSRLFGVGSDICHVGGMKKGVLLDSCEFSWALDDCINVDTEGFMVYKKLSEKEYLLYDRNLKPANYEAYCSGDRFECYQFNTLEFAGTAHLKKAEVVPKNKWPEGIAKFASDFARKTNTPMRTFNGAGLWKMRFSSSPELEEGMLVFTNKYATPGTIIKNCWFHDTGGTAGRSIVCHDAEIRDCRFERVTSIPVFVTMIQSCIQGPMPANVVIENNYIKDCSTSPAYQNRNSQMFGCITVNPIFLNKPTDHKPFKNIVIRGNTIINSPSASILYTSTCGGVIEGNTFIKPVSDKSEAGMFFGKAARSAIYMNACEDILIKNNKVVDPSPLFENEIFIADKDLSD